MSDKAEQIEEIEITKIALSICKEKAHCINVWGEENLFCAHHPYCNTVQTVKALYAADYRKQSETAEEIRNNLEAQGRYEFCALDGKEYLTIQTDKLNRIIKHYTAPVTTGGEK